MAELGKQDPLKKIWVCRDQDAMDAKALEVIKKALADAPSKEVFAVALSGGSMVDTLCRILPQLDLVAEQWRRWAFFFADERLVASEDAESTYGQYRTRLLKVVPDLGLNQFVIINPECRDAKECAFDYYSKMKRSYKLPLQDGFPIFDLIFLGMGPDGHTASLFPGQPSLDDSESWVIGVENSPKPPARRITLSIPLMKVARHILFIVAGGSKADALRQIFVNKVPLPAGLIQPYTRNLNWILDEPAASALDPEIVLFYHVPSHPDENPPSV